MPNLKERGWNVGIGYICRTKQIPQKYWFYANLLKTIFKIIFKQVDLIYFQRADRRWKKTRIVVNLCKHFKIATIFDIDDEIEWKKSKRTVELMKRSDAVIVASHALYDDVRLKHPKTYLLHTPFNEKLYRTDVNRNKQEKVVCGFVGDGRVYFEGLQELFTSLNLMDDNIKSRIKLIYLGDYLKPVERMISSYCSNIEVEIISHFDWSDENALVNELSKWHIGFTPKRINPKGGAYKTIQYLALNIIPLVSNVGENRFFISDRKNGFIIKEKSEWKNIVKKLVENPQLMDKIAKEGRLSSKQYSLENYIISLEQIFKELLLNFKN